MSGSVVDIGGGTTVTGIFDNFISSVDSEDIGLRVGCGSKVAIYTYLLMTFNKIKAT